MRSLAIGSRTLIAIVVASVPLLAQGGPPAKVGVTPVVRHDFRPTLEVLGELAPTRVARVSVEVEGLVREMPVDAGTKVTPETLVLGLDDEIRRLSLAAAAAAADVAHEQLKEYRAGSRVEDVDQAEAAVRQADAELVRSKDELTRNQDLAKKGSVSAQELTQARADVDAARALLEQRQAALARVKAGPRAEIIARAAATLKLREAAVDRLKKEIEKTRICAPFSGVITEKSAEVGQFMRPGDAAVTVARLDPIRAVINVPESAVATAMRAPLIPLALDAFPGRKLEGRLETVVPVADSQARTFPFRLTLANPEGDLLPGMLVRARIPLPPVNGVLAVPRDALTRSPSGHRVFVVRAGKAVPINVTSGLEESDLVQVSGEGLAADDLVVVRGNDRLRRGQPVIVVEGGGSGGGPPKR